MHHMSALIRVSTYFSTYVQLKTDDDDDDDELLIT